jgi:hypothetical protein
MLNTGYLIYNDPNTNLPALNNNIDSAFGNCWLVNKILLTNDRAASLQALGEADLRHVAVAEKNAGISVTEFEADSSASISLSSFDNDTLVYEAVCTKPQFAVMSEIYYPKGWNAYLDGKKVDYLNVNYVLRGIPIPAGQHRIEFIFEPESFKTGTTLMYWSSIVISLVVIGGLFMAYKTQKAPPASKNTP